MKKFLLLLLLFPYLLFAKTTTSELLPKEKSVIEGELDNGFKYSIMYNKKPKHRAELRLLVKVGSLEENQSELGVAHFVEHMAFNGSRHFKKNDLIDYLESIGVQFGGDLNANTSYERTIYMLTVPLEKDNLERSLTVFSDWAGGITFDKKEFNKERGVILEEARLRDGVGERIFKQIEPLIFKNSPYFHKESIGKKEIIKNIPVDDVKDFYKRWYTPELMHFIAVGDFNTTKVEKMIKETFGSLKRHPHPKRVARVIPENNITRIATVWDKEITSNTLSVYYLDHLDPMLSKKDFRRSLVDSMMTELFAIKAKEQIEKENPKATIINFDSTSFNKNRGAYSFSASYKNGDALLALKELYELIFSFQKYGFSKNDLAQVKSQMLASNEKSYARVHDKTSGSLSGSLLYYAQNKDQTFVDYDVAYKLKKEMIKDIKIEEINALFRKFLNFKDRVILFQNATGKTYSKDEVLKTIEDSKVNLVDVSKTKKLPSKLKVDRLKSKKIVNESYHKKTDIYEFTLENGLKVAFKKTDFTKDRVLLKGFSYGGESLYEADKLLEVRNATTFVTNSGVANYSMLELNKILSDKSINVGIGIYPRTEGISGYANKKDIESMFALLYLQLTKPKIDKRVTHNIKNILKIHATEALNNPSTRFSREVKKYYRKNNKRIVFETNETIEKYNEEEILEIFKDRFSDFNNFIVMIVGDISYDEVKSLSQKYLANLPTKKRDEAFIKREIPYRKGSVEFSRNYNNENISHIVLQYESKVPYSTKREFVGDALQKTLNTRLRKLIREDKSGVYGIRASIGLDVLEVKSHGAISFSCDPKRKEELIKMVEDVIAKIKSKPITKEELDVYKKAYETEHETNLRHNSYWLGIMGMHYKHGDSFDSAYSDLGVVKGITVKEVQTLAKKIFDKDRIKIELNPKGKGSSF